MNDFRENLIELIKKFDNKCPSCGRIFLGKAVTGDTEIGGYDLYVGLSDYPLRCGKCPSCAEECYNGLLNYIQENEESPCIKHDMTDYIENEKISEEECKEFLNDIKYELDCHMYLDENYQKEGFESSYHMKHAGELYDLFEILMDALKENN